MEKSKKKLNLRREELQGKPGVVNYDRQILIGPRRTTASGKGRDEMLNI